MAVRKQRLHHRIAAQHQNSAAAMENAHPAVSSVPATPMDMPLSMVVTAPDPSGQYATIAYHEAVPLFTADGAVVPGVPPGSWGQLHAAGRP